jgi:hypothetical protein
LTSLCGWLTVIFSHVRDWRGFFFCRVIMDLMIFLMLPDRRRQSICFSCRDKEEWTLVDSIAYTKLESASLLGCVLSLLKTIFFSAEPKLLLEHLQPSMHMWNAQLVVAALCIRIGRA